MLLKEQHNEFIKDLIAVMRLLFFSDNYYPESNAAANRVHERARILVGLGHEVSVITSCPNFPDGIPFKGYKNKWTQKEIVDGVNVVRVKTFMSPNTGFFLRTIDFSSFFPTALFAALKLPKPDVYIASSPHLFVPLVGVLISKIKRAPLVTEIADIWPESIVGVGVLSKSSVFYRGLKVLERYIYSSSAAIVALTESIKDHVMTVDLGRRAVKVIMNGTDDYLERSFKKDEKDRTECRLDLFGCNDCTVFGYIGNFGPAQDLKALVRTFVQLKHKNYRLLLVGDGAERESLIELLNELGDSRVVCMDRIDRKDVAFYWSLCDIAAVNLSDSPVFKTVIPSKIFDVASVGLPLIISGPKGDASKFVCGQEIGIHVNPGVVSELKEAILKFENEAFRARCSAKALEVANLHTRTRQSTELVSLVESILD